jgi:UDP-N-acetylmuramoyl-L-alanyl-D-glutamate--2,6-diaminopimelate ligase
MAANGVQCVVMEVSSHSLEQKRVFGIDLRLAVFHKSTHDHLDYQKIWRIMLLLKILFDNLKPDAIAILQGDSEWLSYVSNCQSKNISFVGRNIRINMLSIRKNNARWHFFPTPINIFI